MFTKKILSGEKIDFFDKGNNRRDFTFIGDASNLIFKCIFSPSINKIPYEVYNLGRGKNYKISDMIKLLEKHLNKKAKFKYSKHKKEDLKFTEANNTKISNKFKYKNFMKLEDGIKLFVDWFKHNYLKTKKKLLKNISIILYQKITLHFFGFDSMSVYGANATLELSYLLLNNEIH